MEKLTPNRIRKIRQTLGLSKEQLARTLWAAETTVDRWESGSRTPSGIHYRLLIRPQFIDLCEVPFADKLAHAERLAAAWDSQNYPEARVYRSVTWSDIDERCAQQLKEKTLDTDGWLGPNMR